MSQPLFSVIVGIYNGADYIDSAINCLLNQDYDPLEIIIVNDGSTDNTAALAREWVRKKPEKITLINRLNGGVAAARNSGLHAARGEFIGILDVDDLWLPGTLKAFSEALICHPQASVMQGYIRRIWLSNAHSGPQYERDFVPYLAMNAGSMFFRRSVFETVGVFDERPSQNEDTDMHLRIREAGLKIFVLERLALIYHMHDKNITHGLDLKQADFFYVLRNSLERRRMRGQHCALDGLHFISDTRRDWPRVSVVIPLAEETNQPYPDISLHRTLVSISAQSYPDIEIVFVHPPSYTPNLNSLSAACSNARFTLAELPVWDLLEALNAGVKTASGDLLCWCLPGDLWSSHRLRMQLGYLLPGRKFQAVTSLVHFILDPSRSYTPNQLEHLEGHGYQDVLGTLLIHRSVFLASGGFRMYPGQSPLVVIMDWFVRLKETGVPIRSVPRYVLYKTMERDYGERRHLATGELLHILHGAIKRKHPIR